MVAGSLVHRISKKMLQKEGPKNEKVPGISRSGPCMHRSQLEMLEDKLRELRLLTLDPREYDDKTVTLSQLDSLRRELIVTARNNLKFVEFGKVRAALERMHDFQAAMRQPRTYIHVCAGPPVGCRQGCHCLC